MTGYKVDVLTGELAQLCSAPASYVESTGKNGKRREREKFKRDSVKARDAAVQMHGIHQFEELGRLQIVHAQEGFCSVDWSNLPPSMWFTQSVSRPFEVHVSGIIS
jgi:hypothetical protein